MQWGSTRQPRSRRRTTRPPGARSSPRRIPLSRPPTMAVVGNYALLPLALSLLALLIAFGFCVWFLVKDRNFWRNEYRARDQEARQREQHLFDQLLVRTGNRATTEPAAPQSHGAPRQHALDAEELEIIDSRINERVEAGVITANDGHMWARQLRNGSITPAQMERMLWNTQKNEFPGSVADID